MGKPCILLLPVRKSVTLSAATTRSKVAAMQLQASAGDGDEDALSPV